MNKYIKTDLQDSTTLMRAAIMNSLQAINKGEETYINLGKYISHALFLECLEKSGWKTETYFNNEINMVSMLNSPSGKCVTVHFGPEYILTADKNIEVTISMSLSTTCKINVSGDFNDTDQEALKEEVENQIYHPYDALIDTGHSKNWSVNEFTVIKND